MIAGVTFSDVLSLEHFDGGEAMVVGHSGGITLLDTGYGKQVPFPTTCCVVCP